MSNGWSNRYDGAGLQVVLLNMGIWTKREVIEKLDEGWLLSGDVGKNARFRIVNPGQTRSDISLDLEIEAAIVRELHENGVLAPLPVPGKKMMYRKSPR